MRKSRKIQRYRKSYRNKRRRHKTIKKFVGGQGQEGEEKKTFFSVIKDKAGDVIQKGTEVGLNMFGLKRIEEPVINEEKKEEEEGENKNEAVMALSNAASNIADAANSAVAETLNLTDKLNDPQTVERLEQGLENIGKIASPIVDKVADKVADVIEKESPKIAAAGTDMLVSAANAMPGVGAIVSLGKEINDVQAIIASGTESTKEILETVNEGVVEGVQQYEQIKNSANSMTTMPNIADRKLSSSSNLIMGGGGKKLKMLQSAGATINNRIHDSINEFLKNKTHKNKKKVRFNI